MEFVDEVHPNVIRKMRPKLNSDYFPSFPHSFSLVSLIEERDLHVKMQLVYLTHKGQRSKVKDCFTKFDRHAL